MNEKAEENKWYLKEPSLSRRAIEVRRDNKPLVTTGGIGYVYLVIDCSGSMAGNKLDQARKGALNFAKDALAKGYLTGLIQFHSSASHLCEPLRDIFRLEQYLSKLKTGSVTYMAEGINLAHEHLTGKKGTRVMVIVTDGVPNGPGDPGSTLRAREAAMKDNVDIIAIGTDDANQEFLKKLASRTELGVKVSREHLEQSIASSASLLPAIIESKPGDKWR